MSRPLTDAQIGAFIDDGFVRIDGAFSPEIAAQARAILWPETGSDPDDPSTWTRPIVGLGGYSQPPFVAAANTPILHAAFDQLVGAGRWVPRTGLGSFRIRFPSDKDPGDTGWHVDASFPGGDPNDFWNYQVNLLSKDRALLMLFLFSDVGEGDAPTRIRAGSHKDVARILAPEGEAGLSFMGVAKRLDVTEHRPISLATGTAGTVYLCHPFLVHAAQPHHGKVPRFLAQPPLHPAQPFSLDRPDGDYSPVEQAIRDAIAPGAKD